MIKAELKDNRMNMELVGTTGTLLKELNNIIDSLVSCVKSDTGDNGELFETLLSIDCLLYKNAMKLKREIEGCIATEEDGRRKENFRKAWDAIQKLKGRWTENDSMKEAWNKTMDALMELLEDEWDGIDREKAKEMEDALARRMRGE